MTRRILGGVVVIVAAFLFAAPALRADEPEPPPTVEEIRRKIQEEKEKAEQEKDKRKDHQAPEEDEESGECDLFWQVFGEILKILFAYSATVRYADYPYAAEPAHPFGYQTLYGEEPGYSQLAYANLSLEGAYLANDQWGAAGRLAVNLLPLHLHGYSQVLFDPTGTITFYSVNAGLTLPFRRFILNLFLGALGTDLFPEAMLSFGANAQVFLPGKCILELYSLNAAYHTLKFNFLSLSLSYALAAANLGVGFTLNHYADILLLGPLVRLSFWL